MTAVLAYIGVMFLSLAMGVGVGMLAEHKTGSETVGSAAFLLAGVVTFAALAFPLLS